MTDKEKLEWIHFAIQEAMNDNPGELEQALGLVEDLREKTSDARTDKACSCDQALSLWKALNDLTVTARTFRHVPAEDQQWTSIDDDALDQAFDVLEQWKPAEIGWFLGTRDADNPDREKIKRLSKGRIDDGTT